MLASRVRMGSGGEVIKWIWGDYKNIALQKPVSATSTLGANVADRVVDGNKTGHSSRWIGGGGESSDYSPKLTIDLIDVCKIDNIKLYSGHNYPSTSYIISDYDIYYFDIKSKTYRLLAKVTNNTNWESVSNFEEVMTNKIEIRFPFNTDYCRVFEVEIYGRIGFEPFLYKNGLEHENLTGGWIGGHHLTSNPTVIKNSTNLHVAIIAETGSVYFTTKNKIDLTEIKTISVLWEVTGSSAVIEVRPDSTDEYFLNKPNYVTERGGIQEKKITSLQVDDIVGLQHIRVGVVNRYSSKVSVDAKIYAIWLEE